MTRLYETLQRFDERKDPDDVILDHVRHVASGHQSAEEAIENIAHLLHTHQYRMNDLRRLETKVRGIKEDLEYEHPRLKKALIYGAGLVTTPTLVALHRAGAFIAASHLVGHGLESLGHVMRNVGVHHVKDFVL